MDRNGQEKTNVDKKREEWKVKETERDRLENREV